MALVNSEAHSEHVQLSRCDIKWKSVEKLGDVQNEGIPLGLIVQIPPYFLETEDCIFNL
jgi:hypothetical protein